MPEENAGMKNPINHLIAVEGAAIGTPKSKIAALCGVSTTTVSRFLSRPEIRKEVEKQATRIIQAMPRAVDLITKTLEEAHEVKVLPHLEEHHLPVLDEQGNQTYDDQGNPITKLFLSPADAKTRAANIKLRAIGLDAAKQTLTAAGILGTQEGSKVVGAMLMSGTSEELTPLIRGILSQILPGGEDNQDEIEIEPEA